MAVGQLKGGNGDYALKLEERQTCHNTQTNMLTDKHANLPSDTLQLYLFIDCASAAIHQSIQLVLGRNKESYVFQQ